MRFIIKKQRRLQTSGEPSSEILLSLQQNQIDLLFDQLIHKPWGPACWQPFVDVFESTASYTVVMDLPGVDRDSIRVRVLHRKLLIEGSREPAQPAEFRLCCNERPHGIFQRTIDIIQPVRPDIGIKYEQGVLTLTLHKQSPDSGESL